MRWLMPFVLSVALAAGEATSPVVSERKRRGAARERHASQPAACDGPAFSAQGGTFDPATGTLTWFDDDYRYN